MVNERRQDFRDDVRSRIVEAASTLLAEEGSQALTTRAVAHAAGVQAPTIYRLFGDKDGLIDAVAEHVMASYVTGKASATTGDDPVVDLRSAWQTHVEFGLANPDLYALLNTPERAARSPATTAGIDVLRARVRRIAEAGRLRVSEERAVQMIHAAGAGTVLALLAEPAPTRDVGLSEAMFDIVAAGIVADSPATSDTNVSTIAVTFMTVLGDLPSLTAAERTLMAEWVARSVAQLQQTSLDASPPAMSRRTR